MQDDSSGAAMSVPNTLEEALVLLEIVKAERDMLKQQLVESNLTIGALTNLDISAKQMATRGQGKVLAELLASNSTLKELDVSKNCFKAGTKNTFRGADGPGFAMELAVGVGNNGTLETLRMTNNNIATKKTGEALGQALSQNSVLKELDLSSNNNESSCKDGPGFVKGIADGVKHNGAMLWTRSTKRIHASAFDEIPPKGQRKGNLAVYNGKQVRITKAYKDGTNNITWDEPKAKGALTSLNISDNKMATKEAGKALADALAANSVLKELNVANTLDGESWMRTKTSGPAFAQELANGVSANRALVSIDLSQNNIGTKQAHALANILKEHATLKSLCGNTGDETELDMSGKKIGADGVIMLAPEIVANGALTSLNMSNSTLAPWVVPEGWSHGYHGDYSGDSFWKHTDGRRQDNMPGKQDMTGIIALADGIKNNGALVCADGKHYHEWRLNPLYRAQTLDGRWRSDHSSTGTVGVSAALTIKDNHVNWAHGVSSQLVSSDGNVTLNGWVAVKDTQQLCFKMAGKKDITWTKQPEFKFTSTSPDVADQNEDMPLVAGICQHCGQPKDQHRANGTLTSVNILNNYIGIQQAHNLATILKEHPTLKSLCGNTGNETELDISGKGIWVDGAIMLAPEIVTNGALVKFDVSDNRLGAPGFKHLSDGLQGHKTLSELNVSQNYATKDNGNDDGNYDLSGVIAISNAIPTMGALVKFDISINCLKAEGGKALADALKDNTVMQELNIASTVLSDYGRDMSGVVAICGAIPTMGALVSANLLNNKMDVEQVQNLVTILKEHATLKSLCGNKGDETVMDINNLGADGAIMLAPEIVVNGAISIVNILSNGIGTEQANELIKIMESKDNLKTFCGFSGHETELDLSRKGLSAGCAVLVANEVKYNGALTSLNVSDNTYLLNRESGKALADVLKDNTVLKELDVSNNYDRYDSRPQDSVGFTQEFAVGLRSNRALTSLNISNNNIGKFVLPTEWRAVPKYDYSSVETKYKHVDGREQEKHPGKPEGFIAIADAIKTNKTLETIRMGRNKIHGAEAGKALANVVAINTTLKELDLSSQDTIWNDRRDALDAAFMEKFADGLGNNTALTELNISNNNIASIEAINKMGVPSWSTGDEVEWKGMKGKAVHYSSNPEECIGFNNTTGVIAFANAIKNNKVLTSLNVSNNRLVDRVGTGRFDTYVGETYDDNGEIDGEEEVEYEIMEPDFSKVTNLVHNCGALTILNVRNTNVVQYILPPGWDEYNGGWRTSSCTAFIGHDGDVQDEVPEGSTLNAKGAIVLATAMKQNAIEQSRHLVELSLENDPMSRKLRDHTKDLRAFLIATRYFGNDVKLQDVLLKQIAGFL